MQRGGGPVIFENNRPMFYYDKIYSYLNILNISGYYLTTTLTLARL